MFILMYVVSYVGGANLLRYAEGATWLAIVTVKRLTLSWPSLRGINILERIWYWVLFCLVPRPQLRVADAFRVMWSERVFEATSPSWPTSFFVVYYALTTLHVHQFIFPKENGPGAIFFNFCSSVISLFNLTSKSGVLQNGNHHARHSKWN